MNAAALHVHVGLVTLCIALVATAVAAGLQPAASRHPNTAGATDMRSRRRVARPRSRRAARARIERELPDAIELVVLAVRAGHLPLQAMRAALPHLAPSVRDGFAEVVHRVDHGARFADALDALTQHLGPTLSPLRDSLAAADRYGLPLAPVLDRLAADARQQRRRQHDIAARQLPVRLAVPLVLCTLPSFVLLAVVPLLLAAFSSLSF